MKPTALLKQTSLLFVVLLAPLLIFHPFTDPRNNTENQAAAQATSTTQVHEGKSDPVFRSISPAAAAALIDQEQDLLIVDVRTPQERKQFRIADSLLVPVGDVMRGKFNPEADKPILMICAVGGRSYVAGKMMAARGHLQVYNLDGGIESWRRAGMPIETGPEEGAQQ